MNDRVRVRLFVPVIVTAPPLPAKDELVSTVESVKDAVSVAVIVTAPLWPLPTAVLFIDEPSICRDFTAISTSLSCPAPKAFDEIELAFLTTIVP